MGLMQIWAANKDHSEISKPIPKEAMGLYKALSFTFGGILIWAAVLLITPAT